ncbi:histone-lysine N-methyltransferase ATXR6 isoform X3 [Cryptomeria japonica]|uniref:histone-lysine N-methyltransferase ATXR6 isoform X3 n=1 Tax=Cryptomeria japonica TaxID=3369 RepID=UPI0025ABA75C|nr:histone-lysine N-methyltransferase ATXR6 isoform X3 [Cryptomeria japonica]
MVVIMECEKNSSDEDENCVRKRSIVEIYGSCKPVTVSNGGQKRGRRRKNYERIVCKKCGEGYGKGRLLLLCDGCDSGYHMYCLCPILVRIPKGKWFCPACSRKDGIREFPLVQKKIIDFFRIQRPLKIFSETKRRRRHNLCMYKKKQKLIPHVPSKDPEQRLRQMASLATALTSTGVDFCDELTYIPSLAPRSANRVEFEGAGMQVMGKEDKATLELCKLMCARGEWPPLMVSYDPKQGFVVEADAHIKDMTLIAEYTGDVDYMMNREHDESDSLMGLLFSKDPSKELVICPDKRGNIARFVSGINNHTREGRKKQNLRCVRFNIDGEARALLVAFRDIPKGL